MHRSGETGSEKTIHRSGGTGSKAMHRSGWGRVRGIPATGMP